MARKLVSVLLAQPRTRQAKQRAGSGRQVTVSRQLAVETDAADDAPVWVQVAEEGEFRGYAGGAFAFNTAVFNELVANFRRHPSYKAGADGVGVADVVPWDFHHASEHAATDGTIPVQGAPAQGWVQELQVRMGADGMAELWALTRWLEPARSYIKAGQYKWASVTVVFNAVDPKSGVNVGSLLTSIALTNQPFIEGMAPLAADRLSGQKLELMYGYYEPARNATEALESMQRLLQVPITTGVAEVLGQAAMIQGWAVAGGAPLGVDLEGLVGCMRRIFNMPALASNEEVFAEVQRMLGALLEQAPIQEPQTPPPAASPAAAAATRNENTMNIALLAKKLGVQPTAEAVMAALEAKFDFFIKLAKALGLSETAADAVLLEAAEGGKDARARLGALLKALGHEDVDGAIDRIANLMEQSKQLAEVMPELTDLKAKAAAAEEKEIEEDVEEAMASKGYPAELKDALLLERRADKAKFQAKYPRVRTAATTQATAPAAAPHLSLTLAAGPKGSERPVLQQKDGKVIIAAPGRAPNAGGADGTVEINLSRHAGANRFQRLCSYLKDTEDGKNLSWDDICARAHELMVTKGVKFIDAT